MSDELKAGDKLYALVETMAEPRLVEAEVIESGGQLKMCFYSHNCMETVVRPVMDGGREKMLWHRTAGAAISERVAELCANHAERLKRYTDLIPNNY